MTKSSRAQALHAGPAGRKPWPPGPWASSAVALHSHGSPQPWATAATNYHGRRPPQPWSTSPLAKLHGFFQAAQGLPSAGIVSLRRPGSEPVNNSESCGEREIPANSPRTVKLMTLTNNITIEAGAVGRAANTLHASHLCVFLRLLLQVAVMTQFFIVLLFLQTPSNTQETGSGPEEAGHSQRLSHRHTGRPDAPALHEGLVHLSAKGPGHESVGTQTDPDVLSSHARLEPSHTHHDFSLAQLVPQILTFQSVESAGVWEKEGRAGVFRGTGGES